MSKSEKRSENRYSKDQVVIKEGEYGTEFYNIVSGKVGIYINYEQPNQLKVAELNSGEYFGEAAMLESDSSRSATVVAIEETVLKIIHMDDINHAIMNNPEVFLDLIKKYYDKQKKQNTELVQLSGLLEEVCEANEGILELNDRIVKYFNEIGVITRTYEILGFNARIEAAKLGDKGKGFAVVANELRDLATKTKSIASYSLDLIDACNENSELSSDRVNFARELLFKGSNRPPKRKVK